MSPTDPAFAGFALTTPPSRHDAPATSDVHPAGEPTEDQSSPAVEAHEDTPIADSDVDPDAALRHALWEGDKGELRLSQRRALHALVKNRFITAESHPREWATLLDHTHTIETRLNELFFELELDRNREVAYKRQATPESGTRPFPTLLYDQPWNREETVLLVHLRALRRQATAAGTHTVRVERDHLTTYLTNFSATDTDAATRARRATRAVESIQKTGLLTGPADAETLTISPAIDVMLPVDKIHDLITWLDANTPPPTGPTQAAATTGPQAETETNSEAGSDLKRDRNPEGAQ